MANETLHVFDQFTDAETLAKQAEQIRYYVEGRGSQSVYVGERLPLAEQIFAVDGTPGQILLRGEDQFAYAFAEPRTGAELKEIFTAVPGLEERSTLVLNGMEINASALQPVKFPIQQVMIVIG
jgi:hypothetical protein